MSGEAKYRVGVLASGGGSTLEALQQSILDGTLAETEIAFIICNNSVKNPDAGIWERAARLGVPIHHVSNKTQPTCTLPEREGVVIDGTISYEASEEMARLAKEYGVQIVAALGFMRKVVGKLLIDLPVANTHPGPLGPDKLTAGFHGTGVQEEVMRRGLDFSGPTYHWMDTTLDEYGVPAYDTGPEIGHQPVAVTEEMRRQWETEGDVTLLKEEVMRVEKLWVPTWTKQALDSLAT